MATGDYNVRHLPLPSDKMGDQCDGLTVTCQLDWVYTMTLTVTKHEACEENKQPYKWATIALGAVVFVGGIVFVVVVIILCRRRHPNSGLDSGPQRKSEELPTFTGQNIYEGLTPNDPQQNPGAKKHPVKKNAPKREVEGHM
ncbi:uncharacterized protein [Littorina saxatilis]|uniref:uncharacterized protein isoform X2 n=1 Tax=Littorina saxatilis TaxID=31220 RepID=UPI0038B64A4E